MLSQNIITCQIILIIMILVTVARSAKILGIFPSPGYSQFILGEKLMAELAQRGHEVVVISPYQPKKNISNYSTILIDGLVEKTKGNLFHTEQLSVISKIISFHQFGNMLTEYILSHKDVQELLHSKQSFDLVMVERFANEAHVGFAKHFNTPFIYFSSIGLSEWNSHLVGNPKFPSVVPNSNTAYTDHMTFFQRVANLFYDLFDTLYKEIVIYPCHQQLLNKYFPGKINLKDVMFNSSLMLLNSHVTTTQPVFLTSSVIEIGGFHITSNPLPNNIQKFLDEANNGAVFFSMGSNLQSSNMPKKKLDSIVKAIGGLKQKVLWKFENNKILNMPKNLLVSKWLPQSDILAHPNTVAFITHGGLLSTTEAVFHGVPMVGVPIFGDQKMNIARSVQKSIAFHLPYSQISGKTLIKALNEIIQNPSYIKNAKEKSKILKDQPLKPLDQAMFWVEYVLRHDGAFHLRNSSLELYWFQLYLIDITFIVIFLFAIIFYFIKLLVKYILNQNTRRLTKKKQK